MANMNMKKFLFGIILIILISSFQNVNALHQNNNISINNLQTLNTIDYICLSQDDFLFQDSFNFGEAWEESTGDFGSDKSIIKVGVKDITIVSTKWTVSRGFLYFDTSDIPDDAFITSAALQIYADYVDNYFWFDFEIVVQNGMPTYPHDSVEKADYNKEYYSGNGGSKKGVDMNLNEYNEICLNSEGCDWINKEGITKFCLRSDEDINGEDILGSGIVDIASAASSHPPKLEIEYLEMSISKPGNYFYVNNEEKARGPAPIIFGPIDIQLDTNDIFNKVDSVEFYVDDTCIGEDINAPYSLTWNEPATKLFPVINIKAFDSRENMLASTSKTAILYYNKDSSKVMCEYQRSSGLQDIYLVSVDTCISNEQVDEIKNLLNEDLEDGAKPAEILFRYSIDFGDNYDSEIVTTEEPSYSVSHAYNNKNNKKAGSEVDIIFKVDLNYDGDHLDDGEEIVYSFLTQGEKSKSRFLTFDLFKEFFNRFNLLRKIMII